MSQGVTRTITDAHVEQVVAKLSTLRDDLVQKIVCFLPWTHAGVADPEHVVMVTHQSVLHHLVLDGIKVKPFPYVFPDFIEAVLVNPDPVFLPIPPDFLF